MTYKETKQFLKRRDEFFKIINSHLEKRDDYENSFKIIKKPNLKYEVPVWLYNMFIDIQKMFTVPVELSEIQSLDTYCSGHVDYVSKFSLRLAELEIKLKDKN